MFPPFLPTKIQYICFIFFADIYVLYYANNPTNIGDDTTVVEQVALRFSYHLDGVRNARAGVGIVRKETLEQPVTKFTLAILVGKSFGHAEKLNI